MIDGGSSMMTSFSSGTSSLSVTLSPVADADAFAARIRSEATTEERRTLDAAEQTAADLREELTYRPLEGDKSYSRLIETPIGTDMRKIFIRQFFSSFLIVQKTL